MEQVRAGVKRQFSVIVDQDDYEALEGLSKARRTSIAQVIREYIAAGIERDRRLDRLAEAAGIA